MNDSPRQLVEGYYESINLLERSQEESLKLIEESLWYKRKLKEVDLLVDKYPSTSKARSFAGGNISVKYLDREVVKLTISHIHSLINEISNLEANMEQVLERNDLDRNRQIESVELEIKKTDRDISRLKQKSKSLKKTIIVHVCLTILAILLSAFLTKDIQLTLIYSSLAFVFLSIPALL
jgi:predicted RNase H-like nuclease (RuvC/YqgF family)